MMTGDEIKSLRESRTWSQQTMAEALGIDQATVSRIERGVADPSGPVKRLLEKMAAEPTPASEQNNTAQESAA